MNNQYSYLSMIPSLSDIARDPSKVESLPRQVVWDLMVELNGLQSTLLGRLALFSRTPGKDSPQDDRLLDITEASKRLAVSKDWLYRNAKKLPFTKRIGQRQLRFSSKGIDRYIENRPSH